MLYHPKQLAPEPFLSGALYLLQMANVYIRNHSAQITADELSDLGEALHNVPEALTEYGYYFNERVIRDCLQVYDDRWSNSHEDYNLNLMSTLDRGVQRANDWLSDKQ